MKQNLSEFKYFGWDEKNPIGKFTQPKVNPHKMGNAYPADEVGRVGTKTYGRFIDNKGKTKVYIDARSGKATERGKRFYADDEDRDPVRTRSK